MLLLNIGFEKCISDNVDVINEDHCEKDMEDIKMTKNFEIDMNKLENVTGGKEIWWCSELEIDRPSLAESRRPQFGIESCRETD